MISIVRNIVEIVGLAIVVVVAVAVVVVVKLGRFNFFISVCMIIGSHQ